MPFPLSRHSLRRAATGISLAALSILLLLHFVISPIQVQGSSMLPTLAPSQRILFSPLMAKFGLHREDIVVFHHPGHPGRTLIKRIMGLPGEKIEFTAAGILINGVRVGKIHATPLEKCFSVHIPPGEYFVLGDNLQDSLDSRTFGPIPAGWIRGKAVFRYWPVSRLGIPR